jgi:phosphatidylglycerol:prolipoprotein diacylglycerol transferase
MLGGLPLALLLAIPLLPALNLHFGAFWDVAGFTILVGMVVTRVGCLLNGCCSGRPTQSWLGLNLPDHTGVRARRIPTQILEAAWAVLILLAASLTWKWFPFPGGVFLAVMGSYAAGRLVLESTREQTPRGGITAGHWVSGAMVLSAVATLTALWPK